jgi:hypothetical protein
LWIPPSGRPVECPSVEAASSAAAAYAGQKPGTTIAVYQLVGYAYRPVEAPEFVPAASAKAREELRTTGPDTLGSTVPAEGHDARPYRADLDDGQRVVLDALEAAAGPE